MESPGNGMFSRTPYYPIKIIQMFKLICAALVLLGSSAMFLFSKEKPVTICKQDLTGTVREIKKEQGIQLVIEGRDQKTYIPEIIEDGVVIASGARLRVCYNRKEVQPDGTIRIWITGAVFVP
jgi:hypothetical protein